MDQTPPRGGLLASLRGLLATLLATLQVRLELFATELEEEKLRLVRLLVFGAIAFFLLGAGAVFLAGLLTVLLWEEHRLLALGLFAALFLGGGLIALWLALQAARARSRLFEASLAELVQDRRQLEK